MMADMCCCPSGKAVIQSTDSGTVTFTPLLRVLQVGLCRFNLLLLLCHCRNIKILVPLCLGLLPWVKLIDNFDAEYEYVTNEGTVFTFKTNLDAPCYRLINIDFASPAQSTWKELIPQHEKDVIGQLPLQDK